MSPDRSPAMMPNRPPALSAGQRSSAVIQRAILKLALLTVAATAQTFLGTAFVPAFGNLILLTGFLSVLLGVVARDQVRSPYWTFFDEGAWFVLLGHVLVRVA